MNPLVLNRFVTSLGKIKGRGMTGLQRSSQRKMGKAVRRARVSGSPCSYVAWGVIEQERDSGD